jgi:hypothetical protein
MCRKYSHVRLEFTSFGPVFIITELLRRVSPKGSGVCRREGCSACVAGGSPRAELKRNKSRVSVRPRRCSCGGQEISVPPLHGLPLFVRASEEEEGAAKVLHQQLVHCFFRSSLILQFFYFFQDIP